MLGGEPATSIRFIAFISTAEEGNPIERDETSPGPSVSEE